MIFVVFVQGEVLPAQRDVMRVDDRDRFYADLSPADRESTEGMHIVLRAGVKRAGMKEFTVA